MHNPDPMVDPLKPTEERLPEGLRPIPPCPPLRLLLAHQEGVLPEEGAKEIDAHLASCGLCRGLLSDLSELEPRGLTERERESIRRKLPIPMASSGKNWRWYAVSGAIAATLLVCAILALHTWRSVPGAAPQVAETPTQPSEQLTPQNAPQAAPRPAPPEIEVAKLDPPLSTAPGLVLRGAGPIDQPDASQLAPAFDAYEKNNYPLAAERFDLLAKQFPRAEDPVLYLGVTQLLMHDDQAALVSLTRAEQLATARQQDVAKWYRAVAAVRTHDPEAAELLRELCRRDSSAYTKQACDLEQALKHQP